MEDAEEVDRCCHWNIRLGRGCRFRREGRTHPDNANLRLRLPVCGELYRAASTNSDAEADGHSCEHCHRYCDADEPPGSASTCEKWRILSASADGSILAATSACSGGSASASVSRADCYPHAHGDSKPNVNRDSASDCLAHGH